MLPILVGFAFLALVFGLYWVWKRSWNVFVLAEGADGRLSTSKFQVLLWTIVVLFGYVVVETGRFMRGNFDALDKIPPNVLIALGFTLGTATLAKGITTSFIAGGRLKKEPDKQSGASTLVADDDGAPDLSKAQLLAWTLLALVVYVVRVCYQLRVQQPELPDIVYLEQLTSALYLDRREDQGGAQALTLRHGQEADDDVDAAAG